jgi:Na+/H+ antiporter NhaD/arsenite permease-like protein
MHAAIVLLILILTYVGMAAGRIAWLQVDRTGIALLAVIALLASGAMTLDDFGSDLDMPTIAFPFAMMIISAQFAESGFIDLCARTITDSRRRDRGLARADRRHRRRSALADTTSGSALHAGPAVEPRRQSSAHR